MKRFVPRIAHCKPGIIMVCSVIRGVMSSALMNSVALCVILNFRQMPCCGLKHYHCRLTKERFDPDRILGSSFSLSLPIVTFIKKIC